LLASQRLDSIERGGKAKGKRIIYNLPLREALEGLNFEKEGKKETNFDVVPRFSSEVKPQS